MAPDFSYSVLLCFGDPQRAESCVHLPADQGVAQSVGQTAINQHQGQSHRSASQDQRQPRLTSDDWELQQHGERAFQLGTLNKTLLCIFVCLFFPQISE